MSPFFVEIPKGRRLSLETAKEIWETRAFDDPRCGSEQVRF